MSFYELGTSFNQPHDDWDCEAEWEAFNRMCQMHNESLLKLQADVVTESSSLAEKHVLAEKASQDELSSLQSEVKTLKQTREQLNVNNSHLQQHTLQLNKKLNEISTLLMDTGKRKMESTAVLDELKNDLNNQQQNLDAVIQENSMKLFKAETGFRLHLQHLGMEIKKGEQLDSTLFIFTQIDPHNPLAPFELSVTLHDGNQYNISTNPRLEEETSLQDTLNRSDNFTGFLAHVRKLFQRYVHSQKCS